MLGKWEQREAAGQGTGKLDYRPGVHGPGNKAPCSALMALSRRGRWGGMNRWVGWCSSSSIKAGAGSLARFTLSIWILSEGLFCCLPKG